MEVENESRSYIHDDVDLEDTLDQTGFLLQRLQELQTWQQEQELKLLRDQEAQLGHLCGNGEVQVRQDTFSDRTDGDEDDDTTIGQDLSSLASIEESPHVGVAVGSGTAFMTSSDDRDCESITPRGGQPVEALDESTLPSWASREDLSRKKSATSATARQPPLTSLEDRPIIANRKNFDQLLAEHLGESGPLTLQPAPVMEASPAQNSPSKKSFLRKKSGLTRFGGVGAPPKRMVRSKSQTLARKSGSISNGTKTLSGSCPRMNIADKETVAFASKKSATKMSKTPPAKASPVTHNPPAKPISILKLVPSKTSPAPSAASAIRHPAVGSARGMPRPFGDSCSSSNNSSNDKLHDSVELSFMEKLAKAENSHKKDLEDLKTFELLEEAACDSSFCSSSSTVKKLIQNVHHMPSPIPKASISIESLTSTPISYGKSPTLSRASHDSSGNFKGKLENDIRTFLNRNGERPNTNNGVGSNNNNNSDDDDDDDTLEPDNSPLVIGRLQEPNNDDEGPSILNGGSSDDEEEEEANNWFSNDPFGAQASKDDPKKSKNRVRFENDNNDDDEVGDDDVDVMSFSPPRVPPNSASYLIWSLFTKEREENRNKMAANKTKQNQNRPPNKKSDNFSPLSNAKLIQPKSELDFHTTILNAKLTELEKEIAHFKSENEKLVTAKRKLQADRKTLAENVKAFEQMKETEKRKLEEERKWVRREKALFEKMQKDKKSNLERKALEEVEELQAKLRQLNEDLQRKETKWASVVTKLQEQVKLFEKENQHLHQENHKLKVKGVTSKISTHLVDPLYTAKKFASPSSGIETTNGTPDSGIRSQNSMRGPKDHQQPLTAGSDLKSSIYNALCDTAPTSDAESGSTAITTTTTSTTNNDDEISTPRMTFSPAESLDSNVTLVSATLTAEPVRSNKNTNIEMLSTDPEFNSLSGKRPSSNAVVKSITRNEEKGTTEKVYSDGSVEICYANGNRKEVSPEGDRTKVYYYNGDVKETLPSGLVKYFYSQTKTWHLTYPDGKEVLQFSNGQEEVRFPNGNLQISFSDGSIKKISPDGSEHITFPDGIQAFISTNGDRTLLLPNGQKEIHTTNMKRREYPDGTVKILYDDGRQESRYASGRIRIKDREGKLLHDSINSNSTK